MISVLGRVVIRKNIIDLIIERKAAFLKLQFFYFD
jgi:hypothetical protein